MNAQFEHEEGIKRVFARQVTATDNRKAFLWKDPLMQQVIEEAGRDQEYMDVAKLVKQKRDSGYIKTRLPTGHPARQWLKIWDRLGYEENETGTGNGTILLVLDTTRLCIPWGTDEDGGIDGSLMKKVTELLHIPHLCSIKTGQVAD